MKIKVPYHFIIILLTISSYSYAQDTFQEATWEECIDYLRNHKNEISSKDTKEKDFTFDIDETTGYVTKSNGNLTCEFELLYLDRSSYKAKNNCIALDMTGRYFIWKQKGKKKNNKFNRVLTIRVENEKVRLDMISIFKRLSHLARRKRMIEKNDN